MSGPQLPPESEQYLTAMVDLIGRTGSSEFQLRWSDDEDPTVWFAVARYPSKSAVPEIGGPGKSLRTRFLAETAAALDPIMAVYRLAERLMDGGRCVHCERMTVLWDSWRNPPRRPSEGEVCFHVYDPELHRFVMGCKL